MSRKPFSLKTVLLDIGAVLGGALGVSTLMRRLTGTPAEPHDRAVAAVGDHGADVRRGGTSVQTAQTSKAAQAGTTEPRRAPRALDARPDTPAEQPHVDQTGEGSPAPAHPLLPRPTYWPVALAFGITLLAWGFVTTFYITLVGVLVILLAIGGWIGELLHEH